MPVLVLRFLGTGPAGGRPGRGRSRRTESSLAITSDDGTILLDVTRDAAPQIRALERVDLALLTHPHRDASGGLPVLDRLLPAPVPLLSSRATISVLRARYRGLEHLELHGVTSGRPFAWRRWQITPLAVPHARDCTTFAWRLRRGRCSILYASDVARLTRGLAALASTCDLLVLDGAMWRRRIFTHLELESTVPIVARWRVGRVLFT